MKASLVGVFLCFFVSLCSAQAPGDESDRCSLQEYPDNEKTLMDSYNYVNLLPGNGTGFALEDDAVWNDRSYDGNDVIDISNPTYWQQGAGGICRYQVRVCGFSQSGELQNNWFFTQHISKDFDPNIYNYPVDIRVEIRYAGISCRPRHGCNPNFSILTYITNNPQLPSTQGNGFMNRNNYMNNVTITPEDTSTPYTEIHNFTLQPSQTGLYVAIQDYGTCLGISRLRVYRNNCKGLQTGLVIYPDAPAPVDDSVNINIACVDNATVVGSDQVSCHNNGTWGAEDPECQCNLGYESSTIETECTACPAGNYRSADDTTCQPCPVNTEVDIVAAPQCECLTGYFRDDIDLRPSAVVNQGLGGDGSETASDDCTQPPSAPRSLSLDPGQTSITVSWSRPSDEGDRSDLYYQVEHSDPDNFGSYTGTVYLGGGSMSRTTTLSGLRPYTQYCVRVIAHNGVSDQDPDRIQSRTVEECVRTDEAPPAVVVNLQVIYPAVIWQIPETPNGNIDNYILIFTSDIPGQSPVRVETGTTHYVIKEDTLPSNWGNFTVQVIAENGAGEGEISCNARVNPNINTIQRCTLCPEQTVGLVQYPATPSPEDGSITVTAECVANAVVLSHNLSVTCNSVGDWGNENPQCKCVENQIDENTCSEPVTEPPTGCPSCPGNVTVSISEDCTDLYIHWSPVDGAKLYYLRLSMNNNIIHIYTVDGSSTTYKITLNDNRYKDKVISIEIGSILDPNKEIEQYSDPIEVDTGDLADSCEDEGTVEEFNAAHVGISVGITFVLTAVAFTVLISLICILIASRSKTKSKITISASNDFFDNKKEENF